MRNVILLFLLIVGWTTTVCAQNEQETIEVTGIVTDPKNEPLIGVNVTARNMPGFGAITDINGRYKIKVPNYSYLIFSYVGFTKQEIFIKDKKIINIVMAETKETVIDEVVVTGTGAQKKVTVTGAVTTVDVPSYVLRRQVSPMLLRAMWPVYSLARLPDSRVAISPSSGYAVSPLSVPEAVHWCWSMASSVI